MARAELNKALSDLEAIVGKMRDLGVAQWTMSPIGDITLGAPPLAAASRAERAERDPKAARRQFYGDVLGRAVTDAEVEKLP